MVRTSASHYTTFLGTLFSDTVGIPLAKKVRDSRTSCKRHTDNFVPSDPSQSRRRMRVRRSASTAALLRFTWRRRRKQFSFLISTYRFTWRRRRKQFSFLISTYFKIKIGPKTRSVPCGTASICRTYFNLRHTAWIGRRKN
jgi:hypothetical protein